MLRHIKQLTLSTLLLSIIPIITLADISKEEIKKVNDLCQNALTKKRYRDFAYKHIEILRTRSKNYSMTGQLHKEGKRYEFNCFLNKEIKNIKIEDLVIKGLEKNSKVQP